MNPVSITVRVSGVPDSDLLPNAKRRKPWQANAFSGLTDFWREQGKLAGIVAISQYRQAGGTILPLVAPIRCDIWMTYPGSRRVPDIDGSLGLLKAVLDGIADAGVIRNDSNITDLRIRHRKRKGDPAGGVVFVFTETNEQEGVWPGGDLPNI
jgi:Holliday junction resolvase RusA-like endonuclease